MASDFVKWVRSSARTQEELITVERITEEALTLWRQKNRCSPENFSTVNDATRERKNQRCHNPAYQPVLLEATLERTAEVLEAFTEFKLTRDYSGADRIPRALAPLCWMPNLERLIIESGEIADPQMLAEMPALRVLHWSDRLLDDAAPIGACRKLRELHLGLTRPWPRVGALAALTSLNTFHFHGNLFTLEDIPALPEVRTALLAGPGLAARDLRRLPDMPLLEWLDLQPVFGLEGIARYPHLRSLRLAGPMEDLRPLAALQHVTFAALRGNEFRDVSPLSDWPEVRWLQFHTERPRDYSPLAVAPRLHQIEVLGCDIHGLELSAVHAGLDPWETEWALQEPRSLPQPLRFFYHCSHTSKPWWPLPEIPGATWDGDIEMERAERRWFRQSALEVARVFLQLDAPPTRSFFDHEATAVADIGLSDFDQVEQLPGLVEALRPLLFRTRFRHAISISASITVEQALGTRENRGWEEDDDDTRRARREEAERKKREQQEREHRFDLLQSDGTPINPDEFAAPPLEADKVLVPAGAESERPTEPFTSRDDIDPNDEPFDPDAWRFDPDLAEWEFAIHFYTILTEEALLVWDYHAAAVQHYMGRPVEKMPTTHP